MLHRSPIHALVLAILLLPAAARAQVSDADKATARVLAQQGQDALDARDYATAADRFARAGELVHAPTLTLGLARAQVGLGKWVAAQETYNRILREGVPAGAPPVFAKAFADAGKDLDALEPRIPSLVVNVQGAPAARVTLDGAPVPSAALGVNRPVDPGTHVVRAEAEGFVPASATVTVAERRTETVTLRLRRGYAGEAVDPWRAGAPPPREVTAPPVAVAEPAPGGGGTQKTLGFVGIGVGGAGLVMGGVMGGLALGKHSSLASTCPDGHCTDQQSAIDSYHLVANLSTAGFVVGGVLATTGIVLVVTAPRPSGASGAWIAPVAGAGYAGVQGGF